MDFSKYHTSYRLHSSVILSETDVAFSAAINNNVSNDYPIDLFELRNTLQVRNLPVSNMYFHVFLYQFNRQVIPSHTVYATAMENILCTMWHPSCQDMDHLTAVSKWERKYKEKHSKNKSSVTM